MKSKYLLLVLAFIFFSNGLLTEEPDYFMLRKKMIDYIDSQNIPLSEIGSEVPNITKHKFVDLNNDVRAFSLKDFTKHKYIFYSNIYNMFSDEELDILNKLDINYDGDKGINFGVIRELIEELLDKKKKPININI